MRNVGRIFFHDNYWQVQTLENHVGNVTELVKQWSIRDPLLADHWQQTKAWIEHAARIHDDAKPQCFRLLYSQTKREKAPSWKYSFSGHRFRVNPVNPPNAYIDALVWLHHEFSVDGITTKIANLRLDKDEKIKKAADHLPVDLYVLEMCDQIEATLSTTVLESKSAEARVFMDFQFGEDTHNPNSYLLDPYVFQNQTATTLSIEYADLYHPPSDLIICATHLDKPDDAKKAWQSLKQWVNDTLQTATLQSKEVTLRPWTSI